MLRLLAQKNTITYIAVVCALVLIGTAFYTSSKTAQGGQVWLGSMQVVSPKPPRVRSYTAGERMEFVAQYTYHYCGNTLPHSVGQISSPVPHGQAHSAFGPQRPSMVSTGAATGGDAEHRYLFHSTYRQYFDAPLQPGTYWFRYRVGSRNAQGTNQYFTGTVIFKIDPVDRCTNIDTPEVIQAVVPSGYYETVDEDGDRVCYELDGADLICTVSDNPIEIGDSVTFTARNPDGNSNNFRWYAGSNATSLVLTDSERSESSYTTSFDRAGVYRIRAVTETDSGTRECSVGVTVYPDLNTVDPGQLFWINPNAPPGEINFDLENSLTNNTCTANWQASNVLGCEMYRNGEYFQDIEFTGVDVELDPGAYQIKCIQSQDAAVIESDIVVCRLNPGVSEI